MECRHCGKERHLSAEIVALLVAYTVVVNMQDVLVESCCKESVKYDKIMFVAMSSMIGNPRN